MPRVQLRETAVINLNGSGAGTAKLGPRSARETWYPDNAHVKTAGGAPEAIADVFVGRDTTQSNFRDHAVFATTGDSTGAVGGDILQSGDYVWAVWSGGPINAQATLIVTGVRDV